MEKHFSKHFKHTSFIIIKNNFQKQFLFTEMELVILRFKHLWILNYSNSRKSFNNFKLDTTQNLHLSWWIKRYRIDFSWMQMMRHNNVEEMQRVPTSTRFQELLLLTESLQNTSISFWQHNMLPKELVLLPIIQC